MLNLTLKKTIVLLMVSFSFLTYSQKEENNEVKVNLPYMIIGLPEVSYEHIIDSTAAVGISVAYSLKSSIDMEIRFMTTPYFRSYAGDGKAKGFFLEGNVAIINIQDYHYDNNITTKINSTNFGVGGAAGVKFLSKIGIIGEVYAGFVRTIFGFPAENFEVEYYPKLGVSIGRRF